ncbi:MAG: hypothetical protein ACR2IJ_08105 [Fluviibacter sp.]
MEYSFIPDQLHHQNVILKLHGVYRIRITGTELFYIGSTADRGGFYIRFRTHLKDLRRKRHCNAGLQEAHDQHGVGALCFDILRILPQAEVRAAEQKVIEAAGELGRLNVHTSTQGRWTYVMKDTTKQKLSAINAKPFSLKFEGVVYEGVNLTAFAKERGLHQGALTQVLLGNKPQFKGWTRSDVVEPRTVTLWDPDTNKHTLSRQHLPQFSEQHNLNKHTMGRLVDGHRRSFRGWFCSVDPPTEAQRRNARRDRSSPELIQLRAERARASRIKSFTVYKDGVRYEGTNRSAFCRAHKLTTAALWLVLSGARKHFKGFTANPETLPSPPA